MQVTITIPDNIKDRVVNAIAEECGYAASEGTKAQFAKKMVIEYIMDIVKRYETKIAEKQAITDAGNKVESEIILS